MGRAKYVVELAEEGGCGCGPCCGVAKLPFAW